jgi:molybdenum cofactor synthesis domain-containing protein
MPHAAIVTVGDELLCGDVANRNGTWLARQLERLGILAQIIATLPDDRESVASFVRWARTHNDVVVVTGGLGVTPDDVTRAAVADAFGVGCTSDEALAAELRRDGGHGAAFASEWCILPEGSRLLERAAGGAPAFAIENVYVLAGLPEEMRATFRAIRPELRVGPVRHVWRRTYCTTEDKITFLLSELKRLHEGVSVGSYPRFGPQGGEVELVLRAVSEEALMKAAERVEAALAARTP